jgi:hypothetical protein
MLPSHFHLELQDPITSPPPRQCLKQLTDIHEIWHKYVTGYYHDLEHYFWDL